MKIGTMLAVLVSAVAVVAVVASVILNPPDQVRKRRIDGERIQDLNIIQSQIGSYWAVHHELPKDLSAIDKKIFSRPSPFSGGSNSSLRDYDPETGQPYEYEVTGKDSYKLCAVFSTATELGDEPNYLCCSSSTNTSHYCFDYTVGKQSNGLP